MLKRPSAEMITAVSAVVVGVAAIGVGILQADIARQQSLIMQESIRASVWPVLQAEQTSGLTHAGASIAFSLRNAGVGPAVIYGVALARDGQPVDSLPQLAAIAPAIFQGNGVTVTQSSAAGWILAAGDRIDFASASWSFDAPPASDTVELFRSSFAALNAVRIEVCYCSAMRSCWRAASDDRKPPPETPDCEGGRYGEF